MTLPHLLLVQLLVLTVLFVLHLTGQIFFLQWRLWWFDILLHGLGGLWAGFALLWATRRFSLPDGFGVIIVATLAIGLGWELFEVFADMPREDNYALDTITDVTMVVLGGALSFWTVGRAQT